MSVIALADVESTNLEAKQYVSVTGKTPVWISAERQTGGRGRGGKTWASEPGNLYVSGIYKAFENEALNAQCSFAAALAVFDVVKHYAPFANVKIKWPNDVLVGGAKISGILLERAAGPHGEYIIIGVGINAATSPIFADKPTTSLSALGAQTKPQVVLQTLIKRFEHWHGQLGLYGFGPLHAAWTERAYNLGKPVRSKIGDRLITGTAESLDENGSLHIRTRDGAIVKISAGDVFFL